MNAIAIGAVKPKPKLRSLRPAILVLDSMPRLPGALFNKTVATHHLKSTGTMRPLRPARSAVNSMGAVPGALLNRGHLDRVAHDADAAMAPPGHWPVDIQRKSVGRRLNLEVWI